MTLFQAIISGIVQGATEFFPVSSSGHLVLLHRIFGFQESQVAFDVLLHLGTLCAVLLYFGNDVIRFFSAGGRRSLLLLVIGSIPAGVVGILMKERIDSLFGDPRLVVVFLMVTGGWLIFVSLWCRARAARGVEKKLGFFSAVGIGCAQAVAILPGISRSGATIGAGLVAGISPDEAFRFSFLLSIPAIAGASLLKAPEITYIFSSPDRAIYGAGAATAFVAGFSALAGLSWMIRKNRLHYFGIYCLIAGFIGFFAV